MVYLVGEALVGKSPEIAHIDLIIGDKSGPVGTAFAHGMTNVSHGHSPLLAVIRPNLPPKPHTLIIPKVTVKDMGDAEKIFGPAQAAVAKAVADAPFLKGRRMNGLLSVVYLFTQMRKITGESIITIMQQQSFRFNGLSQTILLWIKLCTTKIEQRILSWAFEYHDCGVHPISKSH
jgi:formaldehyde-activating enzyme